MGRVRLSAPRQDLAIALGGLLGGLLLIAVGAYDRRAGLPWWVPVLPLAGMAGLSLLRRRCTVWTVSVGGVLLGLGLYFGSLLATTLLYTDLLYAAVLYGRPRMSKVLALTGGATTLVLTGLAWRYLSISEGLLIGVFGALVFLSPVWTADLLRHHRDRAESERLRAEQTALLAELDRRGAVVSERARMARELHDVIANHLSAIAIHATGAQAVARRQDRAADEPLVEALAVIRENSVQGLAEMRRMIGLLREAVPEEPYAAPRLAALDVLLEQAGTAGRAAGLRFEAEQEGEPGELPAPVELAAYRIVQESLTNAVKHAAPGVVRLRIRYGERELEITVESPYAEGGGRAVPGAKAGLVGMGERAQLLGGEFDAGPDGRTWKVRAVLPRTASEERA
ncbi:sensor histidine kinase [Kitasatospora cheerisanensis]|uniref:histidine kinase n=1 Tax=Kitasatospora cheerisanensis KCTC 2395 TaxID=1348663 RepID=A0A066YUA5_9ACTN|nr:histidine kinase [Kitasatospora cheerisanensis]KDN83569.1 putative two-component system sensor kinase [Kitasatospora cheerisanensis KCTC 2395]